MDNPFMSEIKKIPSVQELMEDFLDYWGNFIEGVFYSDLARSMVGEQKSNYSKQDIKKIFDEVEKIMGLENSRLQELIATCFLQALLAEIEENEETMLEVLSFLGRDSLLYLRSLGFSTTSGE